MEARAFLFLGLSEAARTTTCVTQAGQAQQPYRNPRGIARQNTLVEMLVVDTVAAGACPRCQAVLPQRCPLMPKSRMPGPKNVPIQQHPRFTGAIATIQHMRIIIITIHWSA